MARVASACREAEPRDNTDAAQVARSVRNALGPVVVIGEINFVTSLPKTGSGKIMRGCLRPSPSLLPRRHLHIEDEGSVTDAR